MRGGYPPTNRIHTRPQNKLVTAYPAGGVTLAGSSSAVFVPASGGGGTDFDGLTPDAYISTTGTHTFSTLGTLADPWPLSALNNATSRPLYAGKIVGILNGNYQLINIFGQPSAPPADTRSSYVLGIQGGTSDTVRTRIVGQTAPSTSNPTGGVIFDWQRSLTSPAPNAAEGSTINPLGNYVTITNITFANNNYTAIGSGRNGSPQVSHITVKNCWFKGQLFEFNNTQGSNSAAIYFTDGDSWTITNCRFQDGGGPGDTAFGGRYTFIEPYGTGSSGGSTNVVIEDCSFNWASGNVPFESSIFFKQENNRNISIRRCYFDRSANTFNDGAFRTSHIWMNGADSDASSFIDLYNNVFVGGGGPNGGAAAMLMHQENSGHAGVFNIYYNTIRGPWSGTVGGAFARMWTGNPSQVNIHKNIFDRVSGTAGSECGDLQVSTTGTIGTLDWNSYSPSAGTTKYISGASGGTTTTGLTAWKALTVKETVSIEGHTPTYAPTGAEAKQYVLNGSDSCKIIGPSSSEVGAWGGGVSSIGSSI